MWDQKIKDGKYAGEVKDVKEKMKGRKSCHLEGEEEALLEQAMQRALPERLKWTKVQT